MPSVSTFPNDNHIAAISSWLGGTQYDLRLARVLDQYGWKGTFFLDPVEIGKPGMLSQNDVRGLRDAGMSIGLLISNAESYAVDIQSAVKNLESISSGAVVTC